MALKVTDDMRVYSTDEETCLRQSAGNLAHSSDRCIPDNDACFSIKILDQPSKRSKVRRKVRHIKSFLTISPPGRRYRTVLFLFGNIYTYCVHIHKCHSLFQRLQLIRSSFTHCPFNLLWCDTNAPLRWLNLHKTNAAG